MLSNVRDRSAGQAPLPHAQSLHRKHLNPLAAVAIPIFGTLGRGAVRFGMAVPMAPVSLSLHPLRMFRSNTPCSLFPAYDPRRALSHLGDVTR